MTDTSHSSGGRDSPSGPEPTKVVGAAANAARILRHLAEAGEPLGATQVARGLGINVSTCFDILRTLAQFELVAFDPATKTYTLDLGVLGLAHGLLARHGLLPAVTPRMQRLADAHDVTVSLWRRTPDEHLVLVGIATGQSTMRIQMTVGVRVPLLAGAGGRAVAAHLHLPAPVLAERFAALRWQRPLVAADYLRQVAEARECGHAVDDGYFMRGVLSLSAPVLTASGEPVMALTSVMFSGQHEPATVEQITRETTELARLIGLAGQTNGFD